MGTTKAQEAKIREKNIARKVCSDKFRNNETYREVITKLVSNIRNCINILDEYVQDFDNLTYNAYVDGKTRKHIQRIVGSNEALLNMLIDGKPDNVFSVSADEAGDLKTYARFAREMMDITSEMNEQGLLKAVSTLKLLAK